MHLGFGAKGAFIGQHDAEDGEVFALANHQQFRGGVERVGLAFLDVGGGIAASLVLVNHEATADRIPDFLEQDGLIVCQGSELHGVGVEGQADIAAKLQIAPL